MCTELTEHCTVATNSITYPNPGSRNTPHDYHIFDHRLDVNEATAGSHTSSAEDDTYATAKSRTAGTSSMFLTASEGMLAGNPCASSTRKKDTLNGDFSMQATRGSRDNSPAHSEEGEVISPEQLRFTAAISKAMSKELAPLLADRDPTQARPSVYRGSKEDSIDRWILVTRRYLRRTQAKATPDDRAWSIIGHLEGEARNYIINKAESERDTPEKVFELLASRFGRKTQKPPGAAEITLQLIARKGR